MKSAYLLILSTLLSLATLPGNDFIQLAKVTTDTVVNTTTTTKSPSIFDYWSESETIKEVSIYIDMEELERKRMTPESLTGRLTDGQQSYDLKMEVRGRYRRKTCAMPPLKLHFDKQWLAEAGFNSHNDFKLVTHCTDDAAGQESLLREQLAYELYNIVAPEASFRTQLLKVNYIDTKDGSTTTSYAILIEDTDELKDRLHAKSSKSVYNTPSNKIKNESSITLFNYMIGNSDYSFAMNRNLKLLKIEGEKQSTAVPYDFDFSGLVSAPYANAEKTNTIRRMVWEFGGEPRLGAARGQFLHQEKEILRHVQQFDKLSTSSRQEITNYLSEFFAEIQYGKLAR